MLWTIVILLAFVFLITYDPKSRTLDQYVEPKPKLCDSTHYQNIQFGETQKCPMADERTKMGAILRT